MSKWLSIAALIVFLSAEAFCDSAATSIALQSYKQKFSKADISTKALVLKEAASDRAVKDEAGEFFEYALQFALDNSELLKNDRDIIDMMTVAAKVLRNTGYSASLDSLWKLFLLYPDSTVGAEIIITIGNLGKGNRNVIDSINNFLTEQNMLYKSGNNVNYAVVSACIAAILELGDSSSYEPLFSVLRTGYPEVLAYEAYGAMELIPGNLKQFLFDIIIKDSPDDKYAAFKTGINSEKLSVSDRGQIAELALEQALAFYGPVEDEDISAMRYSAVLSLMSMRWTRANALAIRHYYRVQADFQNGAVSKQRLLEAVAFLGAVGNSDAALVLALQLGLINARTERAGSYDGEITLAIVQALGRIGDKAAFDQLLSVRNLSYSDNIVAAAREALDRLRW